MGKPKMSLEWRLRHAIRGLGMIALGVAGIVTLLRR